MKVPEFFGIYSDLSAEYLIEKYADSASKFISINGINVHYKDEGSGEPIVLVHGIASSLHTWDGWADRLKKSFRVIRFDLPGFGLSSPLPDDDYRIARYVEFLREFTQTLNLTKFVPVGNSMGGIICWHFAAKYPDNVSKMILVDVGGYFRGKLLVVRFGRVPVLGRILRFFSPKYLLERNLAQVYGNSALITPVLVQRYHDLLRKKGNRSALIKRIKADWVFNPEPIRHLQMETLVLWGENDRVLPVTMAELYRRDLPKSEVIVLSNVGHTPMEEEPLTSLQPVLRFLEK